MKKVLIFAVALLGSLSVQEVAAVDIQTLTKDSKVSVNFRYRFEGVTQDGISEDAGASTLRSRFNWDSGKSAGFSLGLEADHVAVIGNNNFNSTANGNAQFPVVADPEGLDLNRAYLAFENDQFAVDLGRQRIVHGAQRFVGGVAWRQNEQTYDAIRLQPKLTDWKVDYSYVWNVNRIFGPDDGAQPGDWFGNSHLLVVSRGLGEGHDIETFAYLLDFENANGPPNSTSTWGVGYTGTFGPVKLNAVLATQSDYADSPLDYSANFYSLRADLKVAPATFTVGHEVLGSDNGRVGFKTPLATLHKFQGWSDKFLGTPAAGLQDTYIGVKGKIGQVTANLVWHTYRADEGSADFGDEVNLALNYPFNERISFQLKASEFNSDTFATDTTKFWLTSTFKL